jgi:hypothetical protein
MLGRPLAGRHAGCVVVRTFEPRAAPKTSIESDLECYRMGAERRRQRDPPVAPSETDRPLGRRHCQEGYRSHKARKGGQNPLDWRDPHEALDDGCLLVAVTVGEDAR